MKSLVSIIHTLALFVGLMSCSANGEAQSNRLEEVVQAYMQQKLVEEQEKQPELNMVIELDSIVVVDSLTALDELGFMVKNMQDEVTAMTAKVAEMQDEYKFQIDLANTVGDKTAEDSLKWMKEEWNNKLARANELMDEIDGYIKQMETADSTVTKCYHVLAYYRLVDQTTNEHQLKTYPFHIGTNFSIIRDPEEFFKMN